MRILIVFHKRFHFRPLLYNVRLFCLIAAVSLSTAIIKALSFLQSKDGIVLVLCFLRLEEGYWWSVFLIGNFFRVYLKQEMKCVERKFLVKLLESCENRERKSGFLFMLYLRKSVKSRCENFLPIYEYCV